MATFESQKKPTSFDGPERLPTGSESEDWQLANRSFWEVNSMRYDWNERVGAEEFTAAWYREIDRRFLGVTAETMPWKVQPFDNLLDFDSLRSKDVLEIGVGNGTHAELIARNAGSYTGIDLTEYATASTSARLRLFGIQGRVLRMDAEQLAFPDESFDLVWSWGVIHHSSDTSRIINEISRVLRPGGRAILMVYYRSWWGYYLKGVIIGIFRGEFFRGKGLHRINQEATDGAIARFFVPSSWKRLVGNQFNIESTIISGNKGELPLIPSGKLKELVLRLLPNSVAEYMVSRLKMGCFLISAIRKKEGAKFLA